MYPAILLGSLPGLAMAAGHFWPDPIKLGLLAAAFIIGQGGAYLLCRRWNY